jgi:hypothetical protein
VVISVCGKVGLCWVCVVILVCFLFGPKLLGCFGFLFEIRVSMGYFWEWLISHKSEVVVGFGVFPASTICSLIWVGSQFGFGFREIA